MNNTTSADFIRGIKTLEDIGYLGGSDILPLINNALFYFSELERKNRLNSEKGGLENLAEFIDAQVEKVIFDYFLKLERVKTINLIKNKLDFSDIDKFLDVFPKLCTVLDCFPLCDNIALEIKANELKVSSYIEEVKGSKDIRAKVYTLTREFLSKKMLLTFDLAEKNQKIMLSLKLAFAKGDRELYKIGLLGEENLTLDGVFKSFVLENEKSVQSFDHLCIEITEDKKVLQYQGLPIGLCSKNSKRKVIHLSFLFRPVSIIIPNEGKIIPPSENCIYTGSGNNGFVQDVSGHFLQDLNILDLFNLLNQ